MSVAPLPFNTGTSTGLPIERSEVTSHSRTGRRRGLVVSIVGPDGAGKTTLTDALQRDSSLCARRVYLGRNMSTGDTLVLAKWINNLTTRILPTAPGILGPALKGARLVGLILQQRYRHGVAAVHRWRGGVVLFDRYEFEQGRKHGSILRRFRWSAMHAGAPRPDLVFILDAPSTTLFARKGEQGVEVLDEMRRYFRSLADGQYAVVVDATASADDVLANVRHRILAAVGKGSAEHGQSPDDA